MIARRKGTAAGLRPMAAKRPEADRSKVAQRDLDRVQTHLAMQSWLKKSL